MGKSKKSVEKERAVPPELVRQYPSLLLVLPQLDRERQDRFVAEEQIRLDGARASGTRCECCGQHVQVYRRTLYGSMARWLISLTRATQIVTVTMRDGVSTQAYSWTQARDIPQRGGDYAKLAYWDLVEQHPDVPAEKRDSGLWRPTARGVNFVFGRVTIPQYAYVYAERVIGLGGPERDIRTCLGKKFNYEELLGSGAVRHE